MTKAVEFLLAALLLTLTTACSSAEMVSIEVISENDQCNLIAAQTRIFNDGEVLRKFSDGLLSNDSKTVLPTVMGQATASNLTTTLMGLTTSHDFSTSKLILFARGSQPNPGYGIDITSTSAALANGKLILPIELLSPDPNKMYAQMLVSPCVLLSVNTDDEIKAVVIE